MAGHTATRKQFNDMDNNIKNMVAKSLNDPQSLTDDERDVIATDFSFLTFNGVYAFVVSIFYKGKMAGKAVKNKKFNTEYNLTWY